MSESETLRHGIRTHPFVPLDFSRLPVDESRQRAASFYAEMNRRRTTRHFAPDPVPRELIELAIRTAGTAPSGAHQQPWTFVAVSDPELKQRIRAAAEREEHAFYHGKAPREWLEALLPLGTDEHKPHLTDAPWLIVMFRKTYGLHPDGSDRGYQRDNRDSSTLVEFFGVAGDLLFSGVVPSAPGNGNFSFFGAIFPDARIGRVVITAGDYAGPDDLPTRDVVMMDDFIFAEPRVR